MKKISEYLLGALAGLAVSLCLLPFVLIGFQLFRLLQAEVALERTELRKLQLQVEISRMQQEIAEINNTTTDTEGDE